MNKKYCYGCNAYHDESQFRYRTLSNGTRILECEPRRKARKASIADRDQFGKKMSAIAKEITKFRIQQSRNPNLLRSDREHLLGF